jgi:hypothetical protein
MMGLRAKLSFTTISTALLLSVIALPVSVVAVVALYANRDSFWSICWLGFVLPIIWLAASVLAVRDALKRHSWRQMIVVAALLVPTALLLATSRSDRFFEHQLFSLKPLQSPTYHSPVVFWRKFLVCDKESPCSPNTAATVAFTLGKVPDKCCTLLVVNGNGTGKSKVETFHVTVNGRPIAFTAGVSTRFLAAVDLNQKNTVSLELRGAPDAYVLVWFFVPPSTKDAVPATHS